MNVIETPKNRYEKLESRISAFLASRLHSRFLPHSEELEALVQEQSDTAQILPGR